MVIDRREGGWWRQICAALRLKIKLLKQKLSTKVTQVLWELAEIEVALRRDEILREISARHQESK
jgi:hypothetical protein